MTTTTKSQCRNETEVIHVLSLIALDIVLHIYLPAFVLGPMVYIVAFSM
jgi:hypothetical protein